MILIGWLSMEAVPDYFMWFSRRLIKGRFDPQRAMVGYLLNS